jgi:hypothetical protein
MQPCASEVKLPALRVASVADDGTREAEAEWQAEQAERGQVDAAPPPASVDAQLTLSALENSDARLDELCESLSRWVHTRKLYGAPRGPVSLLGKLRTGTRALKASGGGPDAACSALLQALYIAVLREPIDALDRQVFERHYFDRVTNIKVAAADLGITRQYWYVVLRSFRRRVHGAALQLQQDNEAEAAAMEARRP